MSCCSKVLLYQQTIYVLFFQFTTDDTVIVVFELRMIFYYTFALQQFSLYYICFDSHGFYCFYFSVALLNWCLWAFLYAFPFYAKCVL